MRFSENDDMIEAIPAYGSDDAFTIWILPRATRRGFDFLDADRFNPFYEFFTVNAFTIP